MITAYIELNQLYFTESICQTLIMLAKQTTEEIIKGGANSILKAPYIYSSACTTHAAALRLKWTE